MKNERTIYISEEHLGDGTKEQAHRMVELLTARGWNIKYGTAAPNYEPFADENGQVSSTDAYNEAIYDQDWEICLNIVSREMDLRDVMTAAEAAEEFGLAEATVRQAINRGTLPARKSGGTWLVRRVDIESRWGTRSIVVSELDTNYNEIPTGVIEGTAAEFIAENDLEIVSHQDDTWIVRSEWGNGEGYDSFRIERE